MMLLTLLCAHALADFPLQGDYLARAKNHRSPLPGTPWWIALVAHAVIHGGFVAAITSSAALGVAEMVAHMAIDWLKCEGRIGYTTDQALHAACKLAWYAIASGALASLGGGAI